MHELHEEHDRVNYKRCSTLQAAHSFAYLCKCAGPYRGFSSPVCSFGTAILSLELVPN